MSADRAGILNERAAQPTKTCAARALVTACTPVCHEHVWVDLTVPAFPHSHPGQFLQLLCRNATRFDPVVLDWPADGFPSLDPQRLLGHRPFLRRPFSIADRYDASDGRVHLAVLSRSVGTGTRWLEHLRPGDMLDITGPLGRGFRVPTDDRDLLLIGGGVGIPPLLYLARHLNESGHKHVTLILGAKTRQLLPVFLCDEPAADGTPTGCLRLPGGVSYPAIVTSNDGSIGLPGLVSDGLRRWYDRRTEDRPATVFACGPTAMLAAVARLTRALDLSCQLCLERHMGCGLGTCLSCVVRVRDNTQPDGWRWALACSDGPVFERDELLDADADARP